MMKEFFSNDIKIIKKYINGAHLETQSQREGNASIIHLRLITSCERANTRVFVSLCDILSKRSTRHPRLLPVIFSSVRTISLLRMYTQGQKLSNV